MLQTIIDLFGPALATIVVSLITGLIGWLTLTLRTKLNIDIEAGLRGALHAALETGAGVAASQGLKGPNAVEAAIAHASISTPDAMIALSPSRQVLVNIATAKLQQLAGRVLK